MQYFDELLEKQEGILVQADPEPIRRSSIALVSRSSVVLMEAPLVVDSHRRRSVYTSAATSTIEGDLKGNLFVSLFYYLDQLLTSTSDSSIFTDTVVIMEKDDDFIPVEGQANAIKTETDLRNKLNHITERRSLYDRGAKEKKFQDELVKKSIDRILLANRKDSSFKPEEDENSVDIDVIVSDIISKLGELDRSDLLESNILSDSDIFFPRVRISVKVSGREIRVISEQQEKLESELTCQHSILLSRLLSIHREQRRFSNVLNDPPIVWGKTVCEYFPSLGDENAERSEIMCVYDPVIDDYVFEDDLIVFFCIFYNFKLGCHI